MKKIDQPTIKLNETINNLNKQIGYYKKNLNDKDKELKYLLKYRKMRLK